MTDSERVNVPVWEYLQHESDRFKRLLTSLQWGQLTPQQAVLELTASHAELLAVMSQLQKASDDSL